MQKETAPLSQNKPLLQTWWFQLQPWLFLGEMYPIILIASILRLYRINTTSFDIDQANVYRMAYDAVHHGMLPVTANFSSLGSLNPPAVIYIYMLPAAFSANPLWGTIMMALLGIVAVLLTYLFTCRYYGRFAGILAALFFAAFQMSVNFSRLIWNQNLLIFFVPLFIIVLFKGVVDRRKGWFFPAVCLLGLMVQMHSSSSFLVAALLVAIVLAPGTIRWRDLVLACLGLLLLYAPYLLWEVHDRFNDISIMLSALKRPGLIDNQAISFYQSYLDGYLPVPQSPIYPLNQLIEWINNIMTPLLILADLMVFGQALGLRSKGSQTQKEHVSTGLWRHLRGWWSNFRADTYRCGLLILLVWQVIPLVALSHHSIPVNASYLIFFLPGQYILIALLFARVVKWLQQFNGWKQIGRFVIYLLAILVIAVQIISSMGYIVDVARGNLSDNHFGRDYSYKLNALQNALGEAEQLAQQRHLKRIYVSIYADYYHMSNMSYLAEHMNTPTTVFSDNCLILPNPTDGPAVLLEGPYNTLTDTLLSHFASATLVDEPKDTGSSDSFKLFIVEAHAAKATAKAILPQEMQPLDVQQFNFQNVPWVVTRWNVLRSALTSYRTAYAYNITNGDQQASDQECLLTSIQAGDQLLRAFPLPIDNQNPTLLDMQVASYTIRPLIWKPKVFNPLGISFETGAFDTSPPTVLQTNDGKDHIVIPISKPETGGSR